MRPQSRRIVARTASRGLGLSFQDAKLIISFGADFLDGWGASVPQQLDFADARAKLAGAPRFVYIGPRRSLTGLNADQWLACTPGSELAIANALNGKGSVDDAAKASGVPAAVIQSLVTELASAKPALVLSGVSGESALDVALAVAEINKASGAVGTTIKPAAAITVVRRDGAHRSGPRRGRANARRAGRHRLRARHQSGLSASESRELRRRVREGRERASASRASRTRRRSYVIS